MRIKDYVLIVKALKRAKRMPEAGVDAAFECIATDLAVDNPNFDYEKFLKAYKEE